MEPNDHLKWIIGDMAFQIAMLNSKVEALEAQVPIIEVVKPETTESK